MEKLKEYLNEFTVRLTEKDSSDLQESLKTLYSVYPFNEFEFIITNLVGLNAMELDDYLLMRQEYIARNIFLHIFEISSPRGFGEQWAQAQLKILVPSLEKPTKRIDATYNGEYDFILPYNGTIIKIEVKASRAVDSKSKEPLYVKALNSFSETPFWMNFQQIKTRCADVFVFIAVWRDTVRYWVFNSKDIESSPHYSKGQHRGNEGEGQLHFRQDNIKLFDKFESQSGEILQKIVLRYEEKLSDK